MAQITISLPDGSQRSYDEGATTADVAASIGSRLAKAAVAARVGGEEWDLGRPLPDGAEVAIITADSDEGRHVMRHSTAHDMRNAAFSWMALGSTVFMRLADTTTGRRRRMRKGPLLCKAAFFEEFGGAPRRPGDTNVEAPEGAALRSAAGADRPAARARALRRCFPRCVAEPRAAPRRRRRSPRQR